VTPAAGFISPGAAILFGVVAAVICFFAIQLVKQKLTIDDSLDVFAVHGVGGMTGSLLLAVFISEDFGGTGYGDGVAMGSQFIGQLMGVGVTLVWSAIVSVIIAVMVGVLFKMRASEDEEREGLDITSHGERAWELD